MSDIYKPEQLEEDALTKKLLLDTAVDVQVVIQLLIEKEIITSDDVNRMRGIVKNFPKYKEAYKVVEGLLNASEVYKNDPKAYLRMLFNEKMRKHES